MPNQEEAPKTTVRRHPERGVYDRSVVNAILDEGFVCHVGFVEDGQPYVIPTLYTRLGETLYLHGSPLSRMLGRLGESVPICVTVTLVDGLVLARSAFNSSVNYRSVLVLGSGQVVEDEDQKRMALRALVEQVLPGRSEEARAPTQKELAATLVVAVPLEEASAKVRKGPPKDGAEDCDLPIWAGELPLFLASGDPVPDPELRHDLPVPAYVRVPGPP